VTGWEAALDLFEENLQEAKKHLAGIDSDPLAIDPLPPWPPSDLIDQPLPPALRVRAQQLFEESERVQECLVELRDAIPSNAQGRRRTHHRRTRPASQRLVRDL
jgi:hypothetical protein